MAFVATSKDARWAMLTRCAVVLWVLMLGGCTLPKSAPADRVAPSISWGMGLGEQPVQGLSGKSPRVRGDPHAALTFYVRADDRGGLRHLSLSGIGTFRCTTRDGSWAAPYDIIVPVAEADISRLLAEADAPETYAFLSMPLQVAQLSCGRQTVPGVAEPQELVPQRGTVLLRAYAVDAAGKVAESVLTLQVRPSSSPQQVAALGTVTYYQP